MSNFKFVEWSSRLHPSIEARISWRSRLWMYHRLANGGCLQIGRLIVRWPMPWGQQTRHLPGYGFDQPSGVRAAMGWPQKKKPVTASPREAGE